MEKQIKHIPMRMCATCRKSQPKGELLRIVKGADGKILPDVTGKAQGRGVYVCKDLTCFGQALKKRSLNKAFKCNVSEDVYKQIEECLVGKR